MTKYEILDRIEAEMYKYTYSQIWDQHLKELIEEIRRELKDDETPASST